MAMYYLSEYQDMMAGGTAIPHVNIIDDKLGFPPPDSDHFSPDPYRCPVSTPANSRRPIRGQATMYAGQSVPDEQMHVSFSNHCEKNDKNSLNDKQYQRRAKNNTQSFNDIRSKGRQYYFIARIQPSGISAKTSPQRSQWLNTLCSQPVEEIFSKYKRRLEASLVPEAWGPRDVSTPGEKALVSAWSCNSSLRSQSCTPCLRTPTPNSRMSVYSPVKGYGYETDLDTPGQQDPKLSLVPVVSSKTLLHKVNTFPRSSVSSVKSHIINFENKRRIKSSNDIYDAYKYKPRKQKQDKLLPRRGNVYKLAEDKTKMKTQNKLTADNENNNLEQSTFEVVSFGASSQEATKQKTVIGGKHAASQCRYCLRDKEVEKLPEISEKG